MNKILVILAALVVSGAIGAAAAGPAAATGRNDNYGICVTDGLYEPGSLVWGPDIPVDPENFPLQTQMNCLSVVW